MKPRRQEPGRPAAHRAAFWEGQALILAKTAADPGVGAGVGKLVAWVAADLGEAAAQDAMPVAGWIMLGVSLAVGAVNIAETSAELALSPWTFVDDLSFTHDLSVTLQARPERRHLPEGRRPLHGDRAVRRRHAARADAGACRTPVPATLPPVVFPRRAARRPGQRLGGVPPGRHGDHGRRAARQGLDRAGAEHRRRRRAAAGHRGAEVPDRRRAPSTATSRRPRSTPAARTSGQPPPAPTDNARNRTAAARAPSARWNAHHRAPGHLAARLRAGYVGYAWRGQSSDPSIGAACTGGGTGQLDTVANLNTADASLGYATSACGLDPGVQVAYNLLSHGSANYYLDTTDRPRRPCGR